MTRFWLKRFAPVLFCILAASSMAFAQVTNATLSGIVTDASGSAIPAAQVRVQNTGTNITQTVEANSSGVYTASQLSPGPYTVTTEKLGFRTSVQTGIILTVGQSATLNIPLQVGDVKETITVTGDAELINTTTAEISAAINEQTIKELPLNGRDPSSLVLLTSGVTNVLNTGGGVHQGETTFPNETGASAGGGRQGSTYYLLDGAPNMDTYMLLAAPFPNADATQEFRVISNNFDAHYGFSPGAVVSIQSKSGTNSFHGGAFEFVRNGALNAANYFSHNVDPLSRNQYGGFAGGPIRKNKLFIFGNYQATRESYTSSTNSTSTPTQAMLNGDFSAVPIPLAAPFATVGGKTNQINPALFSPAAYAIATTALPLGQDPATGLVNYISPAQKNHYDEGTGRVDYTVNDRQRIFLRSFTQYYQQIGGAVNGNLLAVVAGKPGKYYNEVLGHNWMINDSTVNNVTAFWTQMVVKNSGASKDKSGKDVCMSNYINVSERPGHCYLEGFTVSNGFSSNWYEPTGEIRTTYGLSDAVTKTIGNHTIAAGLDIWKQFAQENTDYPSTPIIGFSNSSTGFGLADFLLGDVNTYTQGAGEISSVKGWQLGLFAQDQYRVKPNLTLTAGLRWDPNLPPSSTGGRGSSFRPGQQSTVFPNAPLGMIFPGDKGLNAALMATTYGYFEPRIGLSWQPGMLPHTSIRAGFGLFTGPLPYSAYNHVADIAPFSPTFNLYGVSFDNPWANFAGGNPFPPFASLSYKPPTSAGFQTPVSLQAVFDKDFHLGITESWNFSIEQQLSRDMAIHVAYVGSESYHQSVIIDRNPGFDSKRTTYNSFDKILTDTSLATSPYNSLQIGFDKRYSHGIALQSNFTWSKVLDLGSSGNISFASPLANPFSVDYNRGISDLNVPFISVTNFVYTTPSFGGWNALARNALGAWQVSAIYSIQSGRPFGISGGNGSNNSGALQYGDRADATGASTLVKHGNKQTWIQQYLNPAAFKTNATGTFGNTGRNIFTSPAVSSADAALTKNFKFHERYGVQIRWEMFNALNHTSFATPNNDPTSSNFGKITGIGAITPRVMQGGAKFSF